MRQSEAGRAVSAEYAGCVVPGKYATVRTAPHAVELKSGDAADRRADYDNRKRLGICVKGGCKKPAAETLQCEEHRAAQNEVQRRYKERTRKGRVA